MNMPIEIDFISAPPIYGNSKTCRVIVSRVMAFNICVTALNVVQIDITIAITMRRSTKYIATFIDFGKQTRSIFMNIEYSSNSSTSSGRGMEFTTPPSGRSLMKL